MTDDIKYPIRINRYLALKGLATRREADQLITNGKVKINQKIAKLGELVNKNDLVVLNILRPKVYTYLAYHKPVGEPTKERYLQKLFPLGRLDKDSSGLMLLTDDGRLTDRLLNPKREHEKEYLVTVDKSLKQGLLKLLARGISIEGYKTKPAKVELEDLNNFRITLIEGKRHQIRRMVAAIGYQVINLKRLRIANITLNNLPINKTRPIIGRELLELLSLLGLAT